MKKNLILSRRSFLTAAGAGLAGTLLSGCDTGDRRGSGGITGPLQFEPQGISAARRGNAGLSSNSSMPRRILGNTGLEISILGFGGGSIFLKLSEGDWQQALENAVQGGINLFDTAPPSSSYGPDGESEKRFGQILSEKYRDQVILSTKVDSRDPAVAEAVIEGSFQNLRTDLIDILLIHALDQSDNLDDILGENGIWAIMKRLREEARVRFIGATVMYHPAVALEFVQRAQPDVMLLAMNAFTCGQGTSYADFEDNALQEIRSLGVGVLAMKALRDLVGTGPGQMSVDNLLNYNWNLDTSSVLVGHERLTDLDYNMELATSSQQPVRLCPEEIGYIRRQAQKRKDLPCWMRPGYEEGCPLA